jgi:hypothetical protein
VERDIDGLIVMTEAEAATARAALFVAIHHADDVVGHCDDFFRTITGVDPAAFPALMDELDELTGHNARKDQYLLAELQKLASRDDEALAAVSDLPYLLQRARERGLTIPDSLRHRG